MIGRGNTNIVKRIAVVDHKPGPRQEVTAKPSSGGNNDPHPLPPTQVPASTAGHSVAASTRYLGPVMRRHASPPQQKYLFDGLHIHPGAATIQSHPASGFVYPWIPNPVRRGGGVPQGKTFSVAPGRKSNPLTDPFLPPPKLEILTPIQQTGGVGTGSSGGGGVGGGGGGVGGGGVGGGRLK